MGKYSSVFYTSIDDDGKLYNRWMNKRVNARKEGIECSLTYTEYCQLVHDANLVSSQLGFKGEGYVLARYDDTGDYTYDNCRFTTQKENSDEKFSHSSTHVYCIEDDRLFLSVAHAAKFYGINFETLTDSIDRKVGRIEYLDKTFLKIGSISKSDPNWSEELDILVSKHLEKVNKWMSRREESRYKTKSNIPGSRKPDKETLECLLSIKSMEAIGRELGVSGNTIKSWAKSYGLR